MSAVDRNRLVVGVDGSEAGRHALRWAFAEAAVRDAHLDVVHVWSPPAPISFVGPILAPTDTAAYEQWAKEVLEEDVRLVAAATGVAPQRISTESVRGYPPKVLLDKATDADLLVVGSRGRGGFKGLLLGSVSQHCVVHATAPVAVVRQSAPMPDTSDIVVGVDGSAGSQRALEFALREAAARGARLVVAHAWWVAYPNASADMLPFVSVDRTSHLARTREVIDEMLAAATSTVAAADVDIEERPLEDAPAAGLVALAASASLLVVGSRGRGGFTGLLLGSVSQQCVQHARCGVVVVP